MNDPEITTDELYALNDAITAWAVNCGLRARRQDDTDDAFDDALNAATHDAAAAMAASSPEQPDIHALMNAVRNHPDYVWGTVFVWDDVECVLDDTDAVDIAEVDGKPVDMTLLRNEGHSIGKTLESSLMDSGFGWTDAIRENHITARF